MFGRRPTTSDSATAVATPPAAPAPEEHDDLQPLWQPEQALARKSIEQLLLERGHLTPDKLDQAKDVQKKTPGKSIVQILLTMSAATEEQILSALAETLAIPFEKPTKEQVDGEAFALLQPEYIRKSPKDHVDFIKMFADALCLAHARPRQSTGFEYGWVRGMGSAAFVVGTLLGVVTLLKVLDLGTFTVLDRPFNVVTDRSQLGSGFAFVRDSLGPWAAWGSAAAAVALVGAAVVCLPWAVGRVGRPRSSQRWRRSLVKRGISRGSAGIAPQSWASATWS